MVKMLIMMFMLGLTFAGHDHLAFEILTVILCVGAVLDFWFKA